MRKSLLIKLHLYAGLFTIFYLIAFGFSALVLNHQFKVEKSEVTRVWESTVEVDTAMDNRELAESVRDQLDLMGWTPYWKQKRDGGQYLFEITHPGRNYQLSLDLSTGFVDVKELPKGFLAVLHGLHFLNGNIPNAPFLIKTWAIYQWISLFVMLISIVLGLWLWVKYRYKTWEVLAFGGVFLFTMVIFMLI